MEQPLDIDDVQHAVALRWCLNEMRQNKQNCDTVIKVGKDEMAVHRNVLMAQSDYFNAMFAHDTLENQSGIVKMKDVRFEPVKKCINFFYTGKISTNEEGCEELLYTASLMAVQPVCDKIAPFLQSRLNSKSFFGIRKIAIKFDLKNLSKVCDDFALENLDSIVNEEEFKQIEKEYVLQLMTSKTSADSEIEDSKLATILYWIKADVDNRQHLLINMISVLDLSKVSLGTVKYVVENEPLFCQSVECMKVLVMAGSDKARIQAKPLKMSFPPLCSSNTILMFDISSMSLQAYRPATGSWTKMISLPGNLCEGTYYTAVVDKNNLYVLMQRNEVLRLNMKDVSSGWMQIPNTLKDHDTRQQALVHDGFIYVVGNNSMERYCIEKKKWEEISCNAVPYNYCALVEYSGDLYCIGGRSVGSLNDANKLSHTSLTWLPVKPMHFERNSPAAAVLGSKIYAAGGNNKSTLSIIESFDSETDTWTTLSQMNKPREAFGLCVVQGKLFAIGKEQDPCTIEEFDEERNIWQMVADKPDMKIMARATVAAYVPE